MLRTLSMTSAIILASMSGANAQQTSSEFIIELNNATVVSEGSCQVVFRGQNSLGAALDDVTFRLAVFDKEGVFLTMLSLPWKRMIDGKRRAVQYNLPFACDNISEIIVNDTTSCAFEGTEESSDSCLDDLTVSTRTDIAFGI